MTGSSRRTNLRAKPVKLVKNTMFAGFKTLVMIIGMRQFDKRENGADVRHKSKHFKVPTLIHDFRRMLYPRSLLPKPLPLRQIKLLGHLNEMRILHF